MAKAWAAFLFPGLYGPEVDDLQLPIVPNQPIPTCQPPLLHFTVLHHQSVFQMLARVLLCSASSSKWLYRRIILFPCLFFPPGKLNPFCHYPYISSSDCIEKNSAEKRNLLQKPHPSSARSFSTSGFPSSEKKNPSVFQFPRAKPGFPDLKVMSYRAQRIPLALENPKA